MDQGPEILAQLNLSMAGEMGDREDFSGQGVTVQPFVGLSYPYKWLEGIFPNGYGLNVNGQFRVKSSQNQLKDESINADWSGLRRSTSIHIKLY